MKPPTQKSSIGGGIGKGIGGGIGGGISGDFNRLASLPAPPPRTGKATATNKSLTPFQPTKIELSIGKGNDSGSSRHAQLPSLNRRRGGGGGASNTAGGGSALNAGTAGSSAHGGAGGANTGGGGGGGNWSTGNGANGGKGIVVVRYKYQ